MTNLSIKKLSLISSILGITLLYASAVNIDAGVTPISEIDEEFIGLKTTVSGEVVEATKHSDGHLFLKIKDNSQKEIRIPIFSDTKNRLDNKIRISDQLEVHGEVEKFRGDLQIPPKNPQDISVVHSPPKSLSNVSKSSLGEKIRVKGYISDVKIEKDHKKLFLSENNDELLVKIPKNTRNSSKNLEISEGDIIQSSGKITLKDEDTVLKITDFYNLQKMGTAYD